jgi:hypothetical protein
MTATITKMVSPLLVDVETIIVNYHYKYYGGWHDEAAVYSIALFYIFSIYSPQGQHKKH